MLCWWKRWGMRITVGTTISWLMAITTATAMFENSEASSVAVIENGISGEPEVECGLEAITVHVVTRNPFQGRLYIQGESDDPNCVVSYYSGQQQQSNYATAPEELPNDDRQLQYSLKFGECNMRRQRTLNPRGVAYTFTLIVSFHPIFETEVDRAYRVRCFFSESIKALGATLGVSQLTTQTIEQEFALPTCTYEIRESREGPFVKFAHLGDHVWHVWHCDLAAGLVYGMLIHSCHVDDGQGKQVPVVDNKGCVLDPILLSNIEYDEQAITAYAETRVFKYSDKVQLYFTCTVQLCIKSDGGCDDVTPPVCEGNEYSARPPAAEYSSVSRDQHDDPSHFRHGYEPEKQFFGPIEAVREEIGRNLHFKAPPPPEPPTPPPEFAFLRNISASRELRAKRQIVPSDSTTSSSSSSSSPLLTVAPMKGLKQVAETDLTARVVVFPMAEVQSLSMQSSNSSSKGMGKHGIDICLSPVHVLLLLLGTTLFLSGLSGFAAVQLSRHMQLCRVKPLTERKAFNEKPIDCAFSSDKSTM